MPEPFRILVTGSRDWQDQAVIDTELDALLAAHQNVTVVHGACPTGADKIAADWVVRTFRYGSVGIVSAEPHPADWATYGRAAGPLRNADMAAAGADVCLAFIRNRSRGATHCAREAEAAGIPTRRFTDDG